MPLPWTAVLMTSHLMILAADKVPEFNVDPSCQAAASAAINMNRNADTCKQDEHTARGTLDKDWGTFEAAQKARCIRLIHSGGSPSYVELLTCLELAKQAAALPKADREPRTDRAPRR